MRTDVFSWTYQVIENLGLRGSFTSYRPAFSFPGKQAQIPHLCPMVARLTKEGAHTGDNGK